MDEEELELECCESCLYYNTDTWCCQCKDSPYYNQERRCDDVCENIDLSI